MVAKVAVLVVGLGLCACALLTMRQMRTQAAHELAEAWLRVAQRDNELWRIRADIAAKVTPERVEQMAVKINPLKPAANELAKARGTPASLAVPVTDKPR